MQGWIGSPSARLATAVCFAAVVLVQTTTASATFSGVNGRIAFASYRNGESVSVTGVLQQRDESVGVSGRRRRYS
jgi:hypothetical protein